MTETEWLKERARPQMTVGQLRGTAATRTKLGRRRLRLFGCGCCRSFWAHLKDERLHRAIECAEAFADGLASKAELEASRDAARQVPTRGALARGAMGARESTAASMIVGLTSTQAFSAAFAMTCYELSLAGYCGEEVDANTCTCAILHDVFGNPFRPITFSPFWRTDTAVSLARGMYDSRDFGAMPILADALQDAGCDNDDILTDCRDPKQVHVRGCWVVDLVLEKA